MSGAGSSSSCPLLSHFNERLQNIIKKRKRIESELYEGPSEFVQNLVKNLKLDDLVEERAEDSERVFSNDMDDACQTKCKVCECEVTMNQMRAHTKNKHSMTIKEYKELFGNHRDSIIKYVYHKCGLCQEELLLDADSIHMHVLKHQLSLKEYNKQFIKKKTRKERNKREDNIEGGSMNIYAEIGNLFDSL